jgi:hypothetical protein
MQRGELVLAGFFGLLGLWWVLGALALPYWSGFAPGPGFLPLWLGGALLALVLAFVALGRRAPTPVPESDATPTSDRKPAVIAASLLACIGGIELAGFAVPTFAYLVFLLAVVERRPWPGAAAIAAATTLALHLIFAVWLGVPLPRGPWGF